MGIGSRLGIKSRVICLEDREYPTDEAVSMHVRAYAAERDLLVLHFQAHDTGGMGRRYTASLGSMKSDRLINEDLVVLLPGVDK